MDPRTDHSIPSRRLSFSARVLLFVLFVGSAIAAVLFSFRYPAFFAGTRLKAASTVSFPGKEVAVWVTIADTPYAWAKGLMFVEQLPGNRGMLFMFPDEQKRSFWMKNTLIPLDILFISADKKIVTIHGNAVPCTALTCPRYASTASAMYVLEVNAGFAEQYGIREGDTVEINMQ